METVRSSYLKRLLAVAAVMFIAFATMLSGVTAFAADDGEYYATWDEYKASGQPYSTWNNVADAMDAVFDHALELYKAGDAEGAYDSVNDGYYGYYETTGFERIAMGYIAGSRKTEVELQFSACKSVTKNGGSATEFEEELQTLKDMIHTDANVLDGTSDGSDTSSSDSSTGTSTSAAVATFTACFSIMLREGLEAILIVGAIIAYLAKSANGDKKRQRKLLTPVYIGVVIGIVASFALAWLLDLIKLANTAKQELIEGITALLAVTVLVYVSFWMFSKTESEAWQTFIKDKTKDSAEKGGTFSMAFTAFLAVFREGAEVVLFFQPTLASGNIGSVWAGFFTGCFVLVFVFIGIRYLGLRIPLRPFFTAMSVLISVMAVSFLGAGIKELIEGDVFTMVSPDWLAWIPVNDTLDTLGIYPTLQTLLPQLVLTIALIILYVIQGKKNRAMRAEAETKAAEERAAREAEEKKAADEALTQKIREVVLAVLDEQKTAKQ